MTTQKSIREQLILKHWCESFDNSRKSGIQLTLLNQHNITHSNTASSKLRRCRQNTFYVVLCSLEFNSSGPLVWTTFCNVPQVYWCGTNNSHWEKSGHAPLCETFPRLPVTSKQIVSWGGTSWRSTCCRETPTSVALTYSKVTQSGGLWVFLFHSWSRNPAPTHIQENEVLILVLISAKTI